MALNYGNIETLVREKYIKLLSDNIFNSSYRLKKMKENPLHTLDGGRKIMVPVLYAKGRGGAYSERGLLNINPKQTKTMLTYDWKYLYASINISKQEEDQVRGEAEILNLIETETQLAEKTLIDELSTASYNDGSDSLYPHGARLIFGYDRSIGGVDSTTYTWLDANHCVTVDANYTTTNLTRANFVNPSSDYYMPTVLNKVWMNCIHNGEKPTAAYASKGMYEVYESVLQPFMSFQRNYTGAVKEAADAGFQVLDYHGVPFVYDEYCPAGHIFFDSPKYNGLTILSADNMKMGKFQKPVNQEVNVAKITMTCQFITNNPRMLGVVVGASAIG